MGRVVTRLLSVGVLITWIGSATAIYFFFNYSIPSSSSSFGIRYAMYEQSISNSLKAAL